MSTPSRQSENVFDASTCITLRDPAELFRVASECQQAFGITPWYRGHAKPDWALTPSIHRHTADEEDKARRRDLERSLFMQFQRRAASRMTGAPGFGDSSAWLSIMQHHGGPTCLLDWTESLMIAAFFAVDDRSLHDHDGVIWALHPGELNRVELGISRHALVSPFDDPAILAYQDLLGLLPEPSELVCAMLPHEIHTRMLVQQSVFTFHRGFQSLEDRTHSVGYLRAFRIRAVDKRLFRGALQAVGVRGSTLFPDLERLARELREDMRFK